MKNIILLIILLLLLNLKMARATDLAPHPIMDESLANHSVVLFACSTPDYDVSITESADAQMVVTVFDKLVNHQQGAKKMLVHVPVEITEKAIIGHGSHQDQFLKLVGEKFAISLSRQMNYSFLGLMNFHGQHLLWFQSCSTNVLFAHQFPI